MEVTFDIANNQLPRMKDCTITCTVSDAQWEKELKETADFMEGGVWDLVWKATKEEVKLTILIMLEVCLLKDNIAEHED